MNFEDIINPQHTNMPEMNFYYLHPMDPILPATGISASVIAVKPSDINYNETGMRVGIPSISMSTDIVEVPHRGNEYPAAWLGRKAGLLEGYALPGKGISMIIGHNHLDQNMTGPFTMLKYVNNGDKLFIETEGEGLKLFTVYANEKINETDFDALSQIVGERDNAVLLLTCEDERMDGGYANRRVVAAVPD